MRWFNAIRSKLRAKTTGGEIPMNLPPLENQGVVTTTQVKENPFDISEGFAISEAYAIEREKARIAQESVTTTPINQELEECNNRLTACTLQLSKKEAEIASVMEKCNILLSMVDTLKQEIGKKEVIEIIKEVPIEVIKYVDKEVIKEVIKEVPVEVIKEITKEVPRYIDTPGVGDEAKRYRFIRENYRAMAILWLPGNSGDIFSANLAPSQPTNSTQFDIMMDRMMLTGNYQK
jgi:hypothetical protein